MLCIGQVTDLIHRVGSSFTRYCYISRSCIFVGIIKPPKYFYELFVANQAFSHQTSGIAIQEDAQEDA